MPGKTPAKDDDDKFSETETNRRRDAALRRMLAMPPKPQSEMKVGRKAKAKGAKRSVTRAKKKSS